MFLKLLFTAQYSCFCFVFIQLKLDCLRPKAVLYFQLQKKLDLVAILIRFKNSYLKKIKTMRNTLFPSPSSVGWPLLNFGIVPSSVGRCQRDGQLAQVENCFCCLFLLKVTLVVREAFSPALVFWLGIEALSSCK